MKRVLRIILAALLIVIVAAAAAWYAFPRYVQTLIDSAVEGKNISIQVNNPGLPSLSGISFGRLEVVFDTPPDSCTNSSASYVVVAHNGSLSWKRSQTDSPPITGLIPKILHFSLELNADSVHISQKTGDLTFSDSNPHMRGKVRILRKKGLIFEPVPESFEYGIENGTLVINKLRFDDIAYTFSIDRQNNWLQKPAPLEVASLYSGTDPAPLSNFKAWFGLQKDPENPCGITFKECSVDLFDLRAETPRIDYNPIKQETSFTLILQSLPLEQLPGFRRNDPERPFATGQLNGSIPVELRNSMLRIRNAVIRASAETKLLYYSLEGNPWLSIEAGTGNKESELFSNLNATIALNDEDENLPGIALKSFSAGLFGGSLKSGPMLHDPINGTNSFTFKLENVHLPEHIQLHGDFGGSLKGSLSGTVPLTVKEGRFSINNAFLSSKGNGSIIHAPPREKKSAQENIFGAPRPDATYTYSEPDLRIIRDFEGKTTIDFALKKITRKTSGGMLELSAPKGVLALWHVKRKPSLVSLSKFSAGFLEGSVGIENVDYDMAEKTAETELVLNNIPLQKLLDMQGMKKIYATGSIKGKIPVIMNEGVFEIPTGNMDADQTGKIIYATTPEERAAANESLRFTYEALSNFLYSELISSISMNPDGQSLIRLQLKGANPSFQEGRPVHLNLNVEQNLLHLLRSLTISTNIEEALTKKALQQQ